MMSAVMPQERRRANRFPTDLDARWEGVLTRREGKVVDLSSSGCFLLTSDEVQPGELIRLEILTPEGPWLYLWGEVVYQVEEMGFAVHFTGTTASEMRTLKELLAYISARRGAPQRQT
ncbi:MAG TPA: PilZ domain-containing protein [Pyrinomonadaceae bacterium]|nr:PilZ domain-containing protein [Pyrinomonadaceae bacterium]